MMIAPSIHLTVIPWSIHITVISMIHSSYNDTDDCAINSPYSEWMNRWCNDRYTIFLPYTQLPLPLLQGSQAPNRSLLRPCPPRHSRLGNDFQATSYTHFQALRSDPRQFHPLGNTCRLAAANTEMQMNNTKNIIEGGAWQGMKRNSSFQVSYFGPCSITCFAKPATDRSKSGSLCLWADRMAPIPPQWITPQLIQIWVSGRLCLWVSWQNGPDSSPTKHPQLLLQTRVRVGGWACELTERP